MSVLGFQVRPAIFLVEADAGRREEPPRYESWLSRSWQQSTVPQAPWATLSHGLSLPHQASPAPARRPRKILTHQGWRHKRRPRRCRVTDRRCDRLTRSRGAVADHPRSMAIYPSFLRGKTPNFGERLRDAPGCVMASTQPIPHSPGLYDSSSHVHGLPRFVPPAPSGRLCRALPMAGTFPRPPRCPPLVARPRRWCSRSLPCRDSVQTQCPDGRPL